MKNLLLIVFLLSCSSMSFAQDYGSIDTLHEQIQSLQKYYGYAAGITPSYLMIIGGRIESDDEETYINDAVQDKIMLKDWRSENTIMIPLNVYPTAIKEALSSVHMQYYQDENNLYIIGGYGYWESCHCQTSIPSLLVMDIDKTIDAIVHARTPVPYIRQLTDDRLAVMEGFLEKSGDTFFLLEGRKAYRLEANEDDAFYFVSEYDNQVRSFKIKDNGSALELVDFGTWTDLEAFFDKFENQLAGTYLGSGEYKFKSERYY